MGIIQGITSALVVLYGDTIFTPLDFKVCKIALAKLLSTPTRPLESLSVVWEGYYNQVLSSIGKSTITYIHT